MIEGIITGFLGGTIAQSIWTMVRFRKGKEFSFNDFMQGVKIGGVREEDYQSDINMKRLEELKSFCEKSQVNGLIRKDILYQKIGELF